MKSHSKIRHLGKPALPSNVTPVQVFVVLSMLISWVYAVAWIDHIYPAPGFAWTYFSAPVFLICYIIASKKWLPNVSSSFSRSNLYIIGSKVGPALDAGFATIFILLFFQSCVMFVNVLWGTQEPVMIKGTIKELDVSTDKGRYGSGTTCSLQITYDNEEILKLHYKDLSVCQNYKRGDEYDISMTKGSLGMLYTTRW